jgi:hypothetical protein
MVSEKLKRLQSLLASELIRDRQSGIKLAAELLAQTDQPAEVRAMLERIAAGDPITMVREHAEITMEVDQARRVPRKARPSAGSGVALRCPQGHLNHYTRSEICPEAPQGSQANWVDVSLRCKECGAQFTARVNCSEKARTG